MRKGIGIWESAAAYILYFATCVLLVATVLLLRDNGITQWWGNGQALDTAVMYTGYGFICLMTIMVFTGQMDRR